MTVDITTVGRRTGRPQRIEIWYLLVDGTVYITGTPGPRDWLANVRSDPRVTFHLKESARADLAAKATEVTGRDERARVFAAPSADWYLRQGDSMESLLEDAPMVRLEFVQDSA